MNTRKILEELMAGAFICSVTNETAFSYLCNEGKDIVNEALRPFDRELAQLPDNSAFYLVTSDISNKEDKLAIRKHFEECRDIVEPVVTFLVFISRTNPQSGILTTGQIVRFTQILSSIANNDHHIQQLNQLITLKLFKTSKQGTDEKLKAVFKGMVSFGLLVEKNVEEMIYQVTGKLDYIQEVMQFIVDHEQIENTEEPDNQTELVV
jgi:hypothetical protein